MPHKILLIDDNQTDVELTRRAFERGQADCELVVKEDGQEALDFLFGTEITSGAVTSGLPALILLDLKMPKISGLDVLRHIRQDTRTRRIPLVVLTSSVEDSDVAAAYDLCANSYIRKPVDFKKFAEMIDYMCIYWLQLNEPPYPAK